MLKKKKIKIKKNKKKKKKKRKLNFKKANTDSNPSLETACQPQETSPCTQRPCCPWRRMTSPGVETLGVRGPESES